MHTVMAQIFYPRVLSPVGDTDKSRAAVQQLRSDGPQAVADRLRFIKALKTFGIQRGGLSLEIQ